jgi:hypothetical protein
MTGNHDSFVGISFSEKIEQDPKIPEIIELEIKNPKNKKNLLSKDEVLKEVLAGLKSVNEALGTNYKLSHIYFVPSLDGPSSIYQGLVHTLIIHYHTGEDFKEV